MVEWKTITWFVITLLLMGFFAGIEMAYYSANRLNIELRKKQGGYCRSLTGKVYRCAGQLYRRHFDWF